MAGSRTIMAMACASSPAARQVLRISGPLARPVLEKFEPASAAVFATISGVHLLHLRLGVLTVPVALWWRKAPRSATGEDCLELHIPGAPLLAAELADALLAEGIVEASAGEFTRRALENGKLDLARAEAVGSLVAAESEAERKRAVFVLEGGLARQLAGCTSAIQAVLVPLEMGFDFQDDDIEIPLPSDVSLLLERTAGLLSHLAGANGDAGTGGAAPLVVLSGPANAGKSTLFNALSGTQGALASPFAGTTRDAVEGQCVLDETLVRLVDTAGSDVAPTAADVLAQGRRAAWLAAADLVLEVRAPGQPLPLPDERSLVVVTHADLGTSSDAPLAVSGKTGAGLTGLRAAMLQRLARHVSGSVASARQAGHCRRAAVALERARIILGARDERELAAADLHEALREIACVTGSDAPARLLDLIFSQFCIGK